MVTGTDTDAAALMARYQDYVERKAAVSSESRELYDDLLRHVAAGDLDARALDRGLNSFVQVNGPGYANGLASVSVQFLVGMIQSGSRYAYELFDEIVPGAIEPWHLDPPEFDAADWTDWFQRLIDYSRAERAAQTEALRVVMNRVASGELDPAGVERIVAERGMEQAPDSVGRVADLYFEMLAGLEEVNAAFGNDYLRSIVPGGTQQVVDLRAAPGTAATVALVVTNDEAVRARMRCVVSDVRRQDGIGPAFEPEATIVPDTFDLEPGTRTTVRLSVVLSDDRFEPGPLYVGSIRILSDDDPVVDIPLRIRAET